jgi:hypothetical protein
MKVETIEDSFVVFDRFHPYSLMILFLEHSLTILVPKKCAHDRSYMDCRGGHKIRLHFISKDIIYDHQTL